MKLSTAQQFIISKIEEGWQLKSGVGASPGSPWLSRINKKRLDTIRVSSASVYILYKLGIIDYELVYPIARWRLKEPKP